MIEKVVNYMNVQNIVYHDQQRNENKGFVHITTPLFYGAYKTSPNGLYSIACSDSDYYGECSGFREYGHGRFALLSGQKILLFDKMERPTDGQAADNGTFIINDLMFGDKLNGTFYAFDFKGNLLLKKSVNANLLNNGISDNGRYACFQTCHTENSPDANSLFIYDLDSGEQISKFSPLSGWAKKYHFDAENNIIHLYSKDDKFYRYTFQGVFLDEEIWLHDREEGAKGYLAFDLAKEKAKSISTNNIDDYKDVLFLLFHSFDESMSEHTQSRVNKLLGEIYLKCNNKDSAICYFEKAMILDEKVGVKRLLSKLRS